VVYKAVMHGVDEVAVKLVKVRPPGGLPPASFLQQAASTYLLRASWILIIEATLQGGGSAEGPSMLCMLLLRCAPLGLSCVSGHSFL
jgi:hypothetical protein